MRPTTVFEWWICDRISQLTITTDGHKQRPRLQTNMYADPVAVLDLFPKYGEWENRRIMRALGDVVNIQTFWEYYASPDDTGLGITISWRNAFMAAWEQIFRDGPLFMTFADKQTILMQDLEHLLKSNTKDYITELRVHFQFGKQSTSLKYKDALSTIGQMIPEKIAELRGKIIKDSGVMIPFYEQDISTLEEIRQLV